MSFQGESTQAEQTPSEQLVSRRFFLFLIFFGAIGIFLGGVSLFKGIQSPFVPNASPVAVQQGSDEESQSEQQQRDTDSDGLNDYDELYQYGTSPYLADSDSDGVNDRQEIESGNDPNCPSGQDCTGLGANTNSTQTVSDVLELTNTTTNSTVTNSASSPSTTDDIDMAQLREVLKAAGAPAYVVDSTDDETLLELYNELIAEEGGDTEADASNSGNVQIDDATTLQLLQSLTPAEIRALLVESGVDQGLIDQVDDSELQEIFLDAVQSEFST